MGEDCEIRGVETDSRNCAFGKEVMFVAMRGANHDSHTFVAEMYERGVRAFMCEKECECGAGAGCVVVENSVAALQRLAAAYRDTFTGRVVGITGSNGKTIVKEWISQCAPAEVKLFRSPRSYNSQLGVALSLLMAEGDEDLVLIEAGISHILLICGIITVFMLLSSIISNTFHFGDYNSMIVKGFLEITIGIEALGKLSLPMIYKVVIASCFLAFGGFSVHMQVISQIVDTEIKYKYFFIGRFYQMIFAGIISYLICLFIL